MNRQQQETTPPSSTGTKPIVVAYLSVITDADPTTSTSTTTGNTSCNGGSQPLLLQRRTHSSSSSSPLSCISPITPASSSTLFSPQAQQQQQQQQPSSQQAQIQKSPQFSPLALPLIPTTTTETETNTILQQQKQQQQQPVMIALHHGRSVIGRRRQGNVTHVLSHEGISREHVAIEIEDNEIVFIEDLNSRNLTRLIINNHTSGRYNNHNSNSNNSSHNHNNSMSAIKRQIVLKPHRFYQLCHGNMIMLGNVLLQFLLVSEMEGHDGNVGCSGVQHVSSLFVETTPHSIKPIMTKSNEQVRASQIAIKNNSNCTISEDGKLSGVDDDNDQHMVTPPVRVRALDGTPQVIHTSSEDDKLDNRAVQLNNDGSGGGHHNICGNDDDEDSGETQVAGRACETESETQCEEPVTIAVDSDFYESTSSPSPLHTNNEKKSTDSAVAESKSQGQESLFAPTPMGNETKDGDNQNKQNCSLNSTVDITKSNRVVEYNTPSSFRIPMETPIKSANSEQGAGREKKILVPATPASALFNGNISRISMSEVPESLDISTPGSSAPRSTPGSELHRVLVFETPMRPTTATKSKLSPGMGFVPPTLHFEDEDYPMETMEGISPFSTPRSVVPETPDTALQKRQSTPKSTASSPAGFELAPRTLQLDEPSSASEVLQERVDNKDNNHKQDLDFNDDCDTDCEDEENRAVESAPAPPKVITYSPKTNTPKREVPKQEPAPSPVSVTVPIIKEEPVHNHNHEDDNIPKNSIANNNVKEEEHDHRDVSTGESELVFEEETQSQPVSRKRRTKTRRRVIDEDEASEPETSQRTLKRKRRMTQEQRKNQSDEEEEDAPPPRAPRIFFTGLTADINYKKAIKKIGGTFVEDDVFEELLEGKLTHLVTNKIRRTVKFLCALGNVDHIVFDEWIIDSGKAKKILPEDDYMLHDKETEEKMGVRLCESFERRKQMHEDGVRVFTGKSIFVTPKVRPPQSEMQYIVKCNGGTFINSLTSLKSRIKSDLEGIIIVTCPDDVQYCRQKIFPVFTKQYDGCEADYYEYFYTNEIILTSVMRQEPAPDSQHQFPFPSDEEEEEEEQEEEQEQEDEDEENGEEVEEPEEEDSDDSEEERRQTQTKRRRRR